MTTIKEVEADEISAPVATHAHSCETCEAPLLIAREPNGDLVRLDPTPVIGGIYKLEGEIATEDPYGDASELGYDNHVGTCTEIIGKLDRSNKEWSIFLRKWFRTTFHKGRSKCRKCQAVIFFAENTNGKSVPLEPEIVSRGSNLWRPKKDGKVSQWNGSTSWAGFEFHTCS